MANIYNSFDFFVRAFMTLLPLGLACGGCPQSSEQVFVGHAPLTVSLEFDDATADQYQLRSILSDRGMHGTFFVNSGRIGLPGYMTLAELQSLAADGHEIAGHTVSHLDLATADLAEQKRQICNDRVALLK